MRAFGSAHYRDAERVHYGAGVVAVVFNPLHNNSLGVGRAEIADAVENVAEAVQYFRTFWLPAFLYRFFVVSGRTLEEERSFVPQVFREVESAFHQRNNVFSLFGIALHIVLGKNRHKQFGHFLVGLVDEVFVVVPLGFLVSEAGAGFADVLEREEVDQFLEGEDVAVEAWVPTQQGQEVNQGFWQVALFAVSGRYVAGLRVNPAEWEYREAEAVAVALAQLAVAFWFQQQWQVRKLWHGVGPTEIAVEQHVERCRWQPLFATYNVGDFHQVVVYNVGQVVGWQLVGSLVEDFVVEDVRVDNHLATDQVVHLNVFVWLNLGADYVLLACGNALLHLFFRKGERVLTLCAGVGVVLEVWCSLSHGFQFFWCVESDVGVSRLKQLVDVFLVDFTTFALAVWGVWAANAYAFVELDTQPLERLNNVVFCSWNKAVRVGIFNTEEDFAAVTFGEQVVVECGTNTTDVEGACWAWCEAHPYFFVGHLICMS